MVRAVKGPEAAKWRRRKDLFTTGGILLLIFGFLGWAWVDSSVDDHRLSSLQESVARDLPKGSSYQSVVAFLQREHLGYSKPDVYPGKWSHEIPGGEYEMQASTGMDNGVFGAFPSGIYLKFVFDKNMRLLRSSVRQETNGP